MTEIAPQLIVEPDDGLEPVRSFISSAQSSLLIKQFTFTEPSLVQAVIDRYKAGVTVRVMLNAKRSGGDRANDDTHDEFMRAAYLLTAIATVIFVRTDTNPLIVVGAAAFVGYLGFV